MEKTDRIIKEKAAAAMLGIAPITLRRQSEIGKGPPRVRISDRRVGYRESEVQAFIASRTSDNSNTRQR
ncbi:MAG TPA: AlpA family phage regulatory protein [Acidocella sp.]|nr:AlpA family phage regulatory protein [Acidocella sp.]